MPYPWVLFCVFIGASVSLLAGRLMDRGERIDRGFVFSYLKLSYRRRLIRTIWTLPILPIAVACFHRVYRSWPLTFATGILLGSTFLVQAVWNYRKWKLQQPEKHE